MDPRVEAWVAEKQKGYVAAGATPAQLALWADYNRKRYTEFFRQKDAAERPTPPPLTIAEFTRMMLRWPLRSA